jgi:hypothetical protein
MAVVKERSRRTRCTERRSNRAGCFASGRLLVDTALTAGSAGEQPLRGGHLFQIMPFSVSLRVPLGSLQAFWAGGVFGILTVGLLPFV